jgi:hypothetical protein
MADPVTILLAALSRERLGAPIGAWVDSPDVHGWLLRNGRYFAWLTDELPAGVRMGKSGNCFEEAQRNALKCSRLIYCEGYAAANGEERPVPHGWCIDTKRGLGVVDTVWRGRQSPDRIYYGVPLKKEMIRRFQEKPGKELSLLLWAAAGWPIQSGMIPEGEWRAPLGGEFLAVNLNSQTQCLS